MRKAATAPKTSPPKVNGTAQLGMSLPSQDISPFDTAIGQTGLKRPKWRGVLYEEFLAELRGQRGVKVFREMRDNDAIVGAVMFAVESMLRGVKWRVEGGTDASAQFLQECIDDMRPNFGSTITEVLSMLTYGWSWHEILYKRRSGQQSDLQASSKFKDGKIGWQGWPIRSQDSLFGWLWDDGGQLVAMLQQPPPTFATVTIPTARSLHFTTSIHKENPEGRSLFRSAYRAWLFRRNLETIEAIGAERDLAGLPIIERAEAYKYLDPIFKEILTNVRVDDQAGVIMPLVYDEQGKKLIEFRLITAAGSKQSNIRAIIEGKSKEIAMCVLADFILLGHENVGSFALSSSKTDMFVLALSAMLRNIADTINENAVPRLFLVNGDSTGNLPYLVPGDIEAKDAIELADALQKFAASGMPLFPDPDLEAHVRDVMDLPEKSEEAMAAQEADRQAQMDARAAAMMQQQVPPNGGTGDSTTD